MWRWAALAIVVLVCVLGLLLVGGPKHQEQVVERVGEGEVIRSSSGDTTAPQGTQRPASQPTGRSVKDELCGVSGPDLLRAGNETVQQHVLRVTQPAIKQWKSSLAASADPVHQAIAFALANATVGPGPKPGDEPSKDTPVNNSLVLLAIQTDNPVIYDLAIRQCLDGDYEMTAGACQGLSWRHWAAIDSDNATPWLWIAARASRAGDQQGVEEALARAVAAASIEDHAAATYVVAMGALSGDASPLEKAVAGAEIISISPGGIPIELMSLCSPAAIQQPLRKNQCSAITTALGNHGSTLIDMVIASSLADRLELADDMRAALKAKASNARATLINMPNPWRTTGPDPWTDRSSPTFRCDTVRPYNAFIDALLASGGNEPAALAAISRTAH